MADDQELPVAADEKTADQAEDKTDKRADEQTDNSKKSDKSPAKLKAKFTQFLNWYKSHKKLSIPATVVVLLAILLGIPTTRFAILGNFIKSSFELGVNDDRNYKEVSGAKVTIDGQTVIADANGRAKFTKVKPGKKKVHVEKKYYNSKDVTINVNFGYNKYFDYIHITATGRFVPVVVNNKITGKAVAGAVIEAAGTDTKTDKDGKATIVVPADKDTVDAKVSLDGFNDSKVTLQVTAFDDPRNVFSVTPAGKIYFLSKRTGKINVMKSDLDGQNQTVVLAATGTEEDGNTLLLASRDWQRLALLSRRNTKTAHLYLIDTTANDTLTEIDGGDNATISLTGWSEHFFIYQVDRSNLQPWQANKAAIKSYNSDNKQITTADQTGGEGSGYGDYATEYIGNTFILKDQIVYTKYWSGTSNHLSGKRLGVYKVNPSGAGKTTLKDYEPVNDGGNYISAVLSKPEEAYFNISAGSFPPYWEYDGSNFKTSDEVNADSFSKGYPTFLLSPSGNKTFWSESRDGKKSLLIGDANGAGGKEIAKLSDYNNYGWFGDSYLIASKNDSELYIMSVDGPGADNKVLKITDYHKPDFTFNSYGGGYGGR